MDMTNLDLVSSSLGEIDHHVLHSVMGGVVPKTPSADGGKKAPKPPGKIKRGIAAGLLLGGAIWGEPPSPDDVRGEILRGPQTPPIAGAPPSQPPNPPLLGFHIS